MTSCGETRETTAAKIHRIATVVMALCVITEAAAFGLHAVMLRWHRVSDCVHTKRAVEKGER